MTGIVLAGGLDYQSIAWVALIGLLTYACLAVKSRYARIADAGRVPAALANVIIAYFSIAMFTFGATATARASFPVPGGMAWEGTVAVIGGAAAMVIGACTALEHALALRARRRELAAAPASAG